MNEQPVTPAVSVFMPAFNAEAYVAEAIESVLDQSWTDFELIVIDDASTDGTLEIMRRYTGDPRVRLIAQAVNQGSPVTRNRGLELARGEYIALLDADDLCMPGRLARQIAYLEAHPAIDVVGSEWYRMDTRGVREIRSRPYQRLTPDEVSAYLLFRCALHHPTIAARRAVMHQYRYREDFPVAQDYDMWARMVGRQRFAVMPEPLISYRYHAQQATQAKAVASMERRRACQARMLGALGVRFSAEELRYHSLLYSGRRMFESEIGRPMDRAYVRWAGQWLRTIIQHNDRRRIFEPGALERVVGLIWWGLCRKAARQVGVSVVAEFCRAPLKRSVLASGRLGREIG